MEWASFYESRKTLKGQKIKTCDCCDKKIAKGKSSYTLTYQDNLTGHFDGVVACESCYNNKESEEQLFSICYKNRYGYNPEKDMDDLEDVEI